MEKTDTIIALSTAMGSGSIAVIRMSGYDCIKIINKTFKGKNLEKAAGNTIHFGRIIYDKLKIDQVLVFIYKSPNSYTGEDVIEISCHANQFIVEDIISVMVKNGARHANPGEFTLRAFLNHKLDLVQAESVANIISSKSRLATRNSILQLEGNLSLKIRSIKQKLIDLISNLEIDLDFSEEDITIISDEEIIKTIEDICLNVENLLNSYNYSKVLNGSIEMAIIGKPNVGKSSLLNALLGEDRAIVTPHPGTTRDTIEENVALSNILFKISDTAGIRFSNDTVEKEGIDRSWKRATRADIVLWVTDISEELDETDFNIFQSLQQINSNSTIIVGNKIDLQISSESEKYIKSLSRPVIKISAKYGKGLEKLKDQIAKLVNDKYKNLGEEIVITSLRQKNILQETKQLLINSAKTIKNKLGNEFAVVDIRRALDELGRITGETATEDILNNIFSNFCIGK